METKENRNSEDIVHVRQELVLTVHEVAVSLSKRANDPAVLLDISSDLAAEARKLRAMAK
ncbi:hypothetical protein [Dongia sp.]|uniref:hypothetical protein n=1 Tax=Dongia sp. TaxID=1977262 RepID=UPI0035AE5712